MRALVLTTQTPHHTYFVQEAAREVDGDLHVVVETTAVGAPFDTVHPFEAERDVYERRLWFRGAEPALSDLAQTVQCENINDTVVADLIRSLRPDVTVVFGTRKLKLRLINAAGTTLLNLHGGDPEYYRGLDSHLWAVYHGDFGNLVTTLHVLDEAIDAGPIVGIRPILLDRGMKLHQLRARNTECAAWLVKTALRELAESGRLAARPQRQPGRYYSFMPGALKALCVTKFERYCENLP